MILRCFLFLMFLNASLNAQVLQAGFAIGKSVYWGDLNAPEFSSNLNHNGGLAVQVFGKYNYKRQAGLKVGLLVGKLQGNDKFSSLDWQVERNLSFKSKLYELSVTGEYYIFGFDPTTTEKPFSPYVTAGVALMYFDPTADYLGTTYRLQPLGTEGQGNPGFGKKYNNAVVSLPFGAGAVIKLSRNLDFNFDIVARRAFTDFIDDISGNYVNYNELKALNGETAAILSDRAPEYFGLSEPLQRPTGEQRGGKFVADWYFTAMAGVAFFISDPDNAYKKKSRYRSSCPKF